MQVKQVAELVGTSPDTVRRYAERFQVFMSPSATPPKGQARTFTPFDVNVLAYVVTLKQQALSEVQHHGVGWLDSSQPMEESVDMELLLWLHLLIVQGQLQRQSRMQH